MTLFLRNKDNRTIVDINIYIKTENDYKFIEISSSVDIFEYSNILLSLPDKRITQGFINDISNLSELRGWLWEVYFSTKDNDPSEFQKVIEIVKENLKTISEDYNLIFVED